MPVRQFHYAWEWRLAATPDALWPYVSDTNRFNRDAGVPVVEELIGAPTGSRRLRLRRYGVSVEWEEEPFEWVQPRSFSVVRRYHAGPVSEMRVNTELTPDGENGCILRYTVDAAARNVLGRIAIPFEIGVVSARRFEKVFRKYAVMAQSARRELPEYAKYRIDYLPTQAALSPGGAERLQTIRTSLEAIFPPNIVQQLVRVVTHGDDLSVARIRPYVLADSENESRRHFVDLALHATRAGLLDLQWDVLCPMCRGPKQSNASLGGITQPVHCSSCNIEYFVNFEQSVELTFSPTPAIRHVEVYPFCVGGPQLTPHIVVQQVVKPLTTRLITTHLVPGRYRLRASGIPGSQTFRVMVDGPRRLHLDVEETGWPNEEPTVGTNTNLALTNATSAKRLLVVERLAWSDQALTAAEVIALQEFRDLFSSEALRPGEAINVGSMAILFTDLRESTRMYREIGDAPAFGRVLDHFEVLRQAMKEEEGALIKTIGDAVMAVFRRPAGAIRTVLRAQQLLASLPEGVRALNLKAGVHFGPCIAVTLNDKLDYFGSTVNMAARIGGLSAGGEIVVSETVFADPEVQLLLKSPGIVAESFEAYVKGYAEAPLKLLRITTATPITPLP